MARVEQQLCDGCGRVLTGKHGIEFVRRAALLIKGQIGVLEVDPHSKWREHTYITPTADSDLAFCDNGFECLALYIDTHKMIAAQRRREAMEREAAGEHMVRVAKDPSFTIGRKPDFGRQ